MNVKRNGVKTFYDWCVFNVGSFPLGHLAKSDHQNKLSEYMIKLASK